MTFLGQGDRARTELIGNWPTRRPEELALARGRHGEAWRPIDI